MEQLNMETEFKGLRRNRKIKEEVKEKN